MSFSFSSWWSTTESEVVAIIAKVKDEALVVEHDVIKALNWVVANSSTIAKDINTVTGYAAMLGVTTGNPAFAAAVSAANVAVQALNTVAQAHANGLTDAQAVVQGYVAVKSAQAAVSQAAAAAATTAKTVAPAKPVAPLPQAAPAK